MIKCCSFKVRTVKFSVVFLCRGNIAGLDTYGLIGPGCDKGATQWQIFELYTIAGHPLCFSDLLQQDEPQNVWDTQPCCTLVLKNIRNLASLHVLPVPNSDYHHHHSIDCFPTFFVICPALL